MGYSFDTSSVIHLWDHYPNESKHFDSLYNQLAEKIKQKIFVISDIAMEEVKNKSEQLHSWLKEKGIKIYAKTFEDLEKVRQYKEALGIIQDGYRKGVGENDLLIIAIAKRNDTILVSEEKQLNVPQLKANYKIPTVCKEIAEIKCIDFLELLKCELK